MKETAAAGMLQTTIEKVKDMIDVSTIIGDPVYTESESMDTISGDEDKKRSGSEHSLNQHKKKNKQQLEQKAQHPFKGNFFDFSG